MNKNIFSYKPQEVIEQLQELELPRYRSKQLLDWVNKKLVNDPDQMSNLPLDFRTKLKELYDFSLPQILQRLHSIDGTQKLSLKLFDAAIIEMVIIPLEDKTTLCISSQAGCARDCLFCATGKQGLSRNLETHEIVGQIVLASQLVFPKRITNLVFMGMGEPMDNFAAVLSSLQIIQTELGLSISPRRTTISTCGIPAGIIALADSGIKTKLALSLNSAIASKRSHLMPVNESYSLDELKNALLYFRRKTSYRITMEYIMIPDLNMGDEDIKALKKFVTDISCKINLIPWNPVPDLSFRAPTQTEIESFVFRTQIINQAVTLRKSRGADISGACGQLASITK